MSDFLERYEANLFIQTDSAGEYEFLTCTGVGNVTIPKGARTIKYKQDLRRSGRLVAAGAIQGVADFVTASITRPLETVNNYLHEITCPFNARINWACRGSRTVFTNYQLGALLYDAQFTTGTIETPLAGEGDNDRINTTGELSATRFTYVYPLEGEPLTLTSSSEVFSLVVVPSECASKCGDKIGLGQKVWAGLEGNAYLVGYIMFSSDYGATWDHPSGWSPFTTAGDVSSMVIVDNQNGYRLIVSRGDTIAMTHAEISYTDDEGATGTDVEVGVVDGQTIQMLKKDLKGGVWAAASGGYIYKSENNGVTWTAKTAGTETVQDLYDIDFYDENTGYAIGNSNAFLVTNDGGETWTAGVGPHVAVNLISCAVNYAGDLFVSSEDAELYRTTDEGATWETMLDLTADNITQVRFDEDFRYFGYFTYNSAAPLGTLYRSEDAGNTWAIVGTPATDYTNLGLNCLAICDPNMVYIGGAPVAAASFVAKFTREA